jgi:hypothetical protein
MSVPLPPKDGVGRLITPDHVDAVAALDKVARPPDDEACFIEVMMNSLMGVRSPRYEPRNRRHPYFASE